MKNIGQTFNTYVSWYKKNVMADTDNPPIGILLCTRKDHALVEYALAGLDNQLFVSKYQLELPKQKAMQRFLGETDQGGGAMSSKEWKTVKLKDCCTKIGSGATPPGGKEAYLDKGTFSLIRSQNVLDFFFSYNGLHLLIKCKPVN